MNSNELTKSSLLKPHNMTVKVNTGRQVFSREKTTLNNLNPDARGIEIVFSLFLFMMGFFFSLPGNSQTSVGEQQNDADRTIFIETEAQSVMVDADGNVHPASMKAYAMANKPGDNAFRVRFPDQISRAIQIKSDWVFYSGLKSPNGDEWVYLVRKWIGDEFELIRWNEKAGQRSILMTDKRVAVDGYGFHPIAWANDQNTILLERVELDGADKHSAIIEFNIETLSARKLSISNDYVSTPIISKDGLHLYYMVQPGGKGLVHPTATQVRKYDLNSSIEELILDGVGPIKNIQRLVFDKKSSEWKALPGYFPVGSSNQRGGLNLKLPWPSGVWHCTTRDGTPAPTGSVGSTSTCSDLGSHGYVAWDFDTPNYSNEKVLASESGTVVVANYASGTGGYSPTGYGNWVVIEHSNAYRTLYAHLTSVNVSVGQSVTRGCFLGYEGETGNANGDHIHFEYEYPGGSGNLYTTFSECSCIPHSGYGYTSQNLETLCNSGGSSLNCSGAIPLQCGVAYTGPSSSASSNVTYYGCNTWTETGPERVHTITTTQTGTISAVISNFSGDLDVYILGSCDPNDCLGTVSSSSASYSNAPPGTYYIVVDADDGSNSGYTIVVNAQCTGGSLNCSGAVPLQCGVAYSGPSSSASSNVTYYGCNTWTETGPERVHTVTTTQTGTISAVISNFSGDLDVYILGSCNPNDCLGTVSSSSASYSNAPPGTYYIVVDADDGSGSGYTIVVNAQCVPVCTTPPSPTAQSPGNSSSSNPSVVTTTTPYIDWITSSNTTCYELSVQNRSTWLFEINECLCNGSSDYTIPSGILQNGIEYGWDVRAHGTNDCSGSCASSYSNNLYFVVQTCDPPIPIGTITGTTSACSGQSHPYSIPSQPAGTSITWSVTNGSIISGQGTSSVHAQFNYGISTSVVSVGASGCGKLESGSLNVSIRAANAVTITSPPNGIRFCLGN